jgi:4-amino-4-deoxy-L-arabinose transferase-like glycosyltransferase
LFAAFALRIFDIDAVPVERHADELAGLVGVAKLRSGNTPLVPFFDLRVQYLPLYGIVEYGSALLFGESGFGLRLPAVLFGIVSVVALRWLAWEVTASIAVADASAALFAILPWAVHLSRIAWEPAAVFPFLLGGLAALAAGLRRRSRGLMILAGLLLGIGAYSYRAEAFDATLLAFALLASSGKRAWAARDSLALGAVTAAACVAPLALAVASHPHFFWRDAGIATFGHGATADAFATFVRNYAAHFDLGSLFLTGDGFLDHGPRYGVLYWWMLPLSLLGIALAWRTLPRGSAAVLYFWLAIYPLGGALTNDGVPDFPRTLVGAPLACIFAALGLRTAWRLLRPQSAAGERRRAAAAAAFCVVVAVSVLDFCRTYFLVYPAQSADAFRYGTANLFRTLRTFEGTYARVCFDSIDWYNYETLTGYYLGASRLVPSEGLTECSQPFSLSVVDDPAKAPSDAHLLATIQNYEGKPIDYIYGN